MKLTKLETRLLKVIAYSDYSNVNGAKPKTCDDIGWVWADCVIETNTDKGTFASLVKKGLAKHSGNSGRDACVTLTEEGFKVFETL